MSPEKGSGSGVSVLTSHEDNTSGIAIEIHIEGNFSSLVKQSILKSKGEGDVTPGDMVLWPGSSPSPAGLMFECEKHKHR